MKCPVDTGNAGWDANCSVQMDESEGELLGEQFKFQTTLSKSKTSH